MFLINHFQNASSEKYFSFLSYNPNLYYYVLFTNKVLKEK